MKEKNLNHSEFTTMHKQLQIIVMSRHIHYPVFFSKNIHRQIGPHYVAQRALSKPCCILSGDRRKNLHSRLYTVGNFGGGIPSARRGKPENAALNICLRWKKRMAIGTKSSRTKYLLTIKKPNPKWCLYWCSTDFIDWRYS